MEISTNLQSPTLIPIGSNIAIAPPPGYERGSWRERLGIAADEVLITYFGLISHSKGVHMLLDALEQLPPGFRLLVVGGAATQPQDRAYAAQIERQIDERSLRARVIITGHCDEATVSAHLLAADLAALPFTDGASFRRGSLLAVLAHGVPTVTTTDVPTTSAKKKKKKKTPLGATRGRRSVGRCSSPMARTPCWCRPRMRARWRRRCCGWRATRGCASGWALAGGRWRRSSPGERSPSGTKIYI